LRNLHEIWRICTRVPGGARLFSALAGRLVPYTGSLGARVEELRPGYARVRLPDRRAVRNHLRSIHAMALANLAEMTGNLALMAALPDPGNMIVTGIDMDYLKKARGDVTATCALGPIDPLRAGTLEWEAEIVDASGAVVARGRARCLVRAPAREARA
jgi:uncharacterized protein (TIGR00369 family)